MVETVPSALGYVLPEIVVFCIDLLFQGENLPLLRKMADRYRERTR